MKRIIVVCFFVLAFLISVPGYADKPPVRPILYTYYRQLGWGDSVQIGYVDSNGDLSPNAVGEALLRAVETFRPPFEWL